MIGNKNKMISQNILMTRPAFFHSTHISKKVEASLLSV
jgi:hypothetical protein